jgi:hypothetical protein
MRMVAVLASQFLGQRRRQGDFAAVFPHGALEDADGIVPFAAGGVVPTFDGADRELHVASGRRMRPGLVRQGLQGSLKLRILLKGPATTQAVALGRMLWKGDA